MIAERKRTNDGSSDRPQLVATPRERELNLPTPFVVTEDARLSLLPWAKEQGFTVPEKTFWLWVKDRFGEFLGSAYPSYRFINEEVLAKGISRGINALKTQGLVPIFIDNVHSQNHPDWQSLHLDINRLTDSSGEDLGLSRRPNTPPLLQQFRNLKKEVERRGSPPVFLVDDVLGPHAKTFLRVQKALSGLGIETKSACVGISFAVGKETLENQGWQVVSAKEVKEGADVCNQRDFIPFLPGAGLKMIEKVPQHLSPSGTGFEWRSLPYALTYLPKRLFGQVYSIPPELLKKHSNFCILMAMSIFRRIEESSGHKPVLFKDLPYLPKDTIWLDQNKSVVGELTSQLWRVNLRDYEGLSG